MKVVAVACGPAVTESERRALNAVKSGLISLDGDGRWFLLTNLMFSVTHQLQSDEIDMVAIGPPGVRVIEVKHWADGHAHLAEQEADRVTIKARKVGSTLRRIVPGLPRVNGTVLLTRRPSQAKRLTSQGKVRGVEFHSLKDWRAALRANEPPALAPHEVNRLAKALHPQGGVSIDGTLRLKRLAGYVNLELQPGQDDPFHRVYKGVHSSRKDRVFLHLYDMSAHSGGNAERKARREHDVLHHQLSRFRWAPRILDSFQDAPGYPGEMKFFTVVDPAVPSINKRRHDDQWGLMQRLDFARQTICAVKELHQSTTDGLGLVHRNISPRTILVKHDNSPVLTGFEHVGTPAAHSASLAGHVGDEDEFAVAPEVRDHGLSAADQISDVYSLCASLGVLFADYDSNDGWQVHEAVSVLKSGMEAPEDRPLLEDLEDSFETFLGREAPKAQVPAARYWTEDQEVHFRNNTYRVVTRLGSGGVGTAFKVVELSRSTKREVGTFVGKVVADEATGEQVHHAYRRARQSVSQHPGLSVVFEVAPEWKENEFVALTAWIEGAALAEYAGVVPLLAEDANSEPEELVLGWLMEMCDALAALHRNNLVHGDVSPGNIIVSAEGDEGCATGPLVLTDYDFVTRIGESPVSPGTVLYGSPNRVRKGKVRASDDVFALAASFFHVLFDKEPFVHDGRQAKERGLNWRHGDRAAYPRVADFLDHATDSDASRRFASGAEAAESLKAPPPEEVEADRHRPADEEPSTDLPEPPPSRPPSLPVVQTAERLPNEVPWLRYLLQSYPGSQWGNQETRGLDSDFAKRTYVRTKLEEVLRNKILSRQVKLVVLCGNAGDGKTALLQHLAERLGLGDHQSSQRILEGKTADGLQIRVNLDGSAAWRGSSADELLDKFLLPFRDGPPTEDIVHLLAINDGRLLEWIDRENTNLTDALMAYLTDDDAPANGHIAFYSLNESSHVGGLAWDRKTIQTDFLERLVDRLYGGDEATTIWQPCETCSAQERCGVYRATRVFGPSGLSEDDGQREHARQRLFEALQAVHFRGETHITVRELRAALVYVLFGTDYCSNYHDGTANPNAHSYWDRAFDPETDARQGEVLAEFARLDPALEAHPKIDRRLLRDDDNADGREASKRLASARRRAYFKGGDAEVGLAQGRHLRLFRNAPFLDHADRDKLRTDLCRGVARLGDLPTQALGRDGVVPLRIQPRTPTETSFWSEKPVERFRLEWEFPRPDATVDAATAGEPLDRLHRCIFLVYSNGRDRKERLRLGAELFHRLLELGDGYQLGDVSTDDTFANLSIFLQRLLREDDRELMAWNPIRDDETYGISAEIERPVAGAPRQRLVMERKSQNG